MARLLVLLLIVALDSACGAAQQQGGGPASTAGVETLPSPSVRKEEPPGPPRIVMTSAAGRQEAVPGSFCVDDPVQGVGTCGDTGPLQPVQLTVARPGDELAIALVGAVVVRGAGCHSESGESACIGSVRVRPLGCEEREAAVLPLRPGFETRFGVDLQPGAYELDVFAYFEGEGGRSGDVSGSLGLLVDEESAPEIRPASPADRVCPEG